MKECVTCGRMTADGAERCPDDGGTLLQLFEGPPVVDGKYLLERRLGRGGMGIVCLAEHLVLKRRCALKLILPERVHDPKVLARFRTEAEALGRLEHPGVVHVIDYGVDERSGGIPYLVMERLEGTNLRERIQDRGRLSLAEALPIMDQAARALDFAHQRGILHRDLKPENVFLIERPGETPTAKLLDLGLARFFRTEVPAETETGAGDDRPSSADTTATPPRLTSAGTIVGTISYMAPEALTGAEPSTQGDVYAFGVTLYETLTGTLPFRPGSAAARTLEDGPAPPRPSEIEPSLPRELDELVLAPLERLPAARPRSACAVVSSLRTREHRLRLTDWARHEAPRRAMIAAALALAALVLGVVLTRFAPMVALENRLIDARFGLSEPRDPDPRVLLVSIDEDSLEADATPLVEIGDLMGQRLTAAMEAGAAGVAIDVLLPRQWGASPGFARFVIAHPDRLVLAAESAGADGVVGPEAAQGLITDALGSRRTRDLFAFVNLPAEPDGKVRRFQSSYLTTDGDPRPTFAARAATILGSPPPSHGKPLIDLRVDSRRLARVSWKDLGTELDRRPERFAGRLLVLGVEFAGNRDVHRVPHPASLPGTVSGPALQALILNTLISEPGLRATPRALIMAFQALSAIAVGGALLWYRRSIPTLMLLAGGATAWTAVAVALFRMSGRYLPVTEVAVVAGLAAALALVVRRQLPPRPEPL